MKKIFLPIFFSVLAFHFSANAGDWDNEISYDGEFSEFKIMGLALNRETVRVYNPSSGEVSAFFFANTTREEEFAGQLAVLLNLPGKVFIFPLFFSQPADKSDYEINRVKSYLKTNKMTPRYRGFHPQYHIVSELLQNNRSDTAVFSGRSCLLPFLETSFNSVFKNYVMLSPPEGFLETVKVPENTRFLWVGSKSEETRLLSLQKKFGGEVLVYENAGSGYTVFFRNMGAQEDLKKWLLGGA